MYAANVLSDALGGLMKQIMATGNPKKPTAGTRSREAVPAADQRELCYDSLGTCGKPGCDRSLNIATAKSGVLTTVGVMAHIVAAQDGGPRGDLKFPHDKRERYDNLILLCPDCHTEVDNPANFEVYTTKVLQEWKNALKKRRSAALSRAREQPAIQELGALLDALATADPIFGDSFERTKLDRKIEINVLSRAVAATISRNVIHIQTVSHQIAQVERSRPNYGEMIKTRMAAEWMTINDRGTEGDEAYDELKDMLMFKNGQVGSEGVVDIVLAYFFERCTILHHEQR